MRWDDPAHYDADITRALTTPGGHLNVGRGGFTLHAGHTQLSGYNETIVKPAAIAAGLPVIDSRSVPFDIVAKLVVRGPMIAVNRAPDPPPWHAFAYAPLETVAAVYSKAGAEVFNLSEHPDHDGFFTALPPGPLAALIDFWLDHVCAHSA
jgi:hypothetical protein